MVRADYPFGKPWRDVELVVVLEQSEGREGLGGVEGGFCLFRSVLVFVESRIDDRVCVGSVMSALHRTLED